MSKRLLAIAAAALSLPMVASAQVGVNGLIGSEWTGITPVQVLFDEAAPTSNFGSPTNLTAGSSYEIFMRADANYLYTAVRTTGNGISSGLFANLYYSVRYGPGPVGNNGSSIAFQITNDNGFDPNVGTLFPDAASPTPGTTGLIRFATTNAVGSPSVIESAIDLSVFLGNALGIPTFTLGANTPVGIRLNLSQSFGYSVAGGQASYGDTRLGYVSLPTSAVPEPSTYALMAAGLAGLLVLQHRRRRA
jgi:hypothetical protein